MAVPPTARIGSSTMAGPPLTCAKKRWRSVHQGNAGKFPRTRSAWCRVLPRAVGALNAVAPGDAVSGQRLLVERIGRASAAGGSTATITRPSRHFRTSGPSRSRSRDERRPAADSIATQAEPSAAVLDDLLRPRCRLACTKSAHDRAASDVLLTAAQAPHRGLERTPWS